MSRKKRGNGEGSVSYVKAKRLWRARVSVWSDDGRLKRHTRYGQTKSEALKKLADLQHQEHEGTLVEPNRMIVSELMERWLASIAGTVAPSTHDSYERIVSCHVNPAIGHVKVSTVRAL